jgi:hypothetical protein
MNKENWHDLVTLATLDLLNISEHRFRIAILEANEELQRLWKLDREVSQGTHEPTDEV